MFAGVLSDVGASFRNMFRAIGQPFRFMFGKSKEGSKGFFEKLGERFSTFKGFVYENSAQPIFWIALIFAAIYGFFSYRTFFGLTHDLSITLLLVIAYVVVFAIVPFITSKHLYEYFEKDEKSIADKALIIFESIVASIFAIFYPVATVWNHLVHQENIQYSAAVAEIFDVISEYPYSTELTNEGFQVVLVVVLGIIPIFVATAIGFMNYRRLRAKQHEIENTNETAEADTPPESLVDEVSTDEADGETEKPDEHNDLTD